MPSRRALLKTAVGSLLVHALLSQAKAGVRPGEAAVRAWLRRHDEIAQALQRGEIAPVAWQDAVEQLAQAIDIAALQQVLQRTTQRDLGRGMPSDPRKHGLSFLDEHGERQTLHYGAALFTFDRANVITPHGHRHMVSAHLLLSGRLRVRNFDRIGDEADADGKAMLLRPTVDRVIEAGALSSMSSQRNNVHWFVPQSATAVTFDIVLSDLDRGQPSYLIEAVDPLGGRRLADGSIRAPIIPFAESSRRYPASV